MVVAVGKGSGDHGGGWSDVATPSRFLWRV